MQSLSCWCHLISLIVSLVCLFFFLSCFAFVLKKKTIGSVIPIVILVSLCRNFNIRCMYGINLANWTHALHCPTGMWPSPSQGHVMSQTYKHNHLLAVLFLLCCLRRQVDWCIGITSLSADHNWLHWLAQTGDQPVPWNSFCPVLLVEGVYCATLSSFLYSTMSSCSWAPLWHTST